jgi:hypothetical protein
LLVAGASGLGITLPPAGNPDPLDALRADERPQRAHEPDAPADGQVNHLRRPVNGNEQGPHHGYRVLTRGAQSVQSHSKH